MAGKTRRPVFPEKVLKDKQTEKKSEGNGRRLTRKPPELLYGKIQPTPLIIDVRSA